MHAERRIYFSPQDLVEFARTKGLQVPDVTPVLLEHSPALYVLDEGCEAEIGYDAMASGIELRWGEVIKPELAVVEVTPEAEPEPEAALGFVSLKARNRAIRKGRRDGTGAADLAERYELSTGTIYRILRRGGQ